MAAGMFAAATNLTNLTTQIFSKPTSLSAYTLHSANGPAASSASPAFGASSSSSSTSQASKAFTVGLWRVVGATHKTTGKEVSVWMFEKRVLEGIKGSAGRGVAEAREWIIDQMKKEVS
jgi:SCY1-like protein 2